MTFKYIILILFLLFFINSSQAIVLPETIDYENNTVAAEDSQIKFVSDYQVNSNYVDVYITSKTYTGNIDAIFGFDTDFIKPKKGLYFKDHYVDTSYNSSETFYYVTNIRLTTEDPDYGNDYNSVRRKIDHKVFSGYDPETNESIWDDVYDTVIAFDSQENDGTNYTVTWLTNQQELKHTYDISDKFEVKNFNYDNKNKWYLIKDQPVVAGNEYHLRIYADIIPQIGNHNYKFDFGIKPSSETLQEAINSGHLKVVDPWWDVSWLYKTNSIVSSVEFPYQMKLFVHSGNGTNDATDVFLNNHSNTNFTDIRFTLDNTTSLNYWIEDNTSNPATVWINVTTNGTVNLYYGNPTATDASNGIGTFILFDDFDGAAVNSSGLWTVTTDAGASQSVANSNLTQTTPATANKRALIHSLNTYSNGNYAVKSKQIFPNNIIYQYYDFGFIDDGGRPDGNGMTDCAVLDERDTEYFRVEKDNVGNDNAANWATGGAFHLYEILWLTSLTTLLEDNVSLATDSTDIPIDPITVSTGSCSNVVNTPSSSITVITDWIFLRKYIDPEPNWGVWSSEETRPLQPPSIEVLSVYPSIISQNSTGWCNISFGITHENVGLNNSSVSFVFREWDNNYNLTHYSIRPPSNNRSESIANITDERIFRAENRNDTLNFENNNTITGGDIYTWGGMDENSTRLTIEAVNSTYTKVHINSSLFGLVLAEEMWYLDRTDLLDSTKDSIPIHKNHGVLYKYWDMASKQGMWNYIGVGFLETQTSGTTPTAPIELYWLNNSYDPSSGMNPLDCPYVLYAGSMNYSEWINWNHVEKNSNYVFTYTDGAILNYFATTDEIGYYYLISSTSPSAPYYFAATDDSSTTNVSFADTQMMWSVNPGVHVTQESYTPNFWTGAFFNNSVFQYNLYVADNYDVWNSTGVQNISIQTGDIKPTNPTIHCIIDEGITYYNGEIEGQTFYNNIQICVGPSIDPDGGNVTHNLTLHYANNTFVTVINNTFTDKDHENTYVNITFDTIPYYSINDSYTLRVIGIDDENNSVTVWLDKNFYLGAQVSITTGMPLSLFIFFSAVMFCSTFLTFLLPGFQGLINNILSIILSYSLSQKIINGSVIISYGGISSLDIIVIDSRVIESPTISYIYLFVGIIMVMVFVINIINIIKDMYTEDKTDLEVNYL